MQLFWYADLISVKIVVFPLQLLSLRLPQGIPGCSSFMYMCVILFIYDSSDLYHSVVSNFPLAPLLCAAVLYKDEFCAKQGCTGQNRIRTFNYHLWGIFSTVLFCNFFSVSEESNWITLTSLFFTEVVEKYVLNF